MDDLREVALIDLADYINGRAFKPAEWGRQGLPIIRIANLNDPKAPFDRFGGELAEGHRATNGDILVSWSASLDAFVWNGEDAAVNQHIFKVVSKSTVDRAYLYFVLKAAMRGLSERAHGATMQHVTRPEFEGFKVRVHCNGETQKRVSALLRAEFGELAAAREAAQKQAQDIALLRQRLLAEVFSAAANAPLKLLSDHAPTTSGSTPSRGIKAYWTPAEVPWVKTGEVAFSPITQTEESVSTKALKECSLTLLPAGTVLVAMYGQGKTRGQSAVLKVPATTNQACFAILPNDTWDPEFLFHWLMASYHDLRALSEGRGGNQANLNGELLNALEIPTPSRDQQIAIARRAQDALQEIDALAAANAAQLEELDRLPQRLLAQAFAH